MRFALAIYLFGLLALLLSAGSCLGYDYCGSSNPCTQQKMKHFICDKESTLPQNNDAAYIAAVLPPTHTFKEIVLDIHNSYRDDIAKGELKTASGLQLPGAKRMQQLIWDDELAYTARVHASTLSHMQSECRSVDRFPEVGEITMLAFKGGETLIKDIIKVMMDPLYFEHSKISSIETFLTKPTEFSLIGNFAILANDRVSRVGCGFVKALRCTSQPNSVCYFMTCHYNSNSEPHKIVYEQGDPASDCKSWNTVPSQQYTNLCKNKD